MNRRIFLTTGVVGFSTFALLPTHAFCNNNYRISFKDLGNGCKRLYDQIEHIPVASLSQEIQEVHHVLTSMLREETYVFNPTELFKLNDNCLAIPWEKNPLIGFTTKGLAFIIKDKTGARHYILDEKTSDAFNFLIENFAMSSDSNQLNLDILAFVSPVSVIRKPEDNTMFAYKNVNGDTITLKSSGRRSISLIG